MKEEKKLKPVTFIKGHYNYHRDNKFQQNLLLKAMQITTDPEKLKEMIGVKTVAEVYRTLDKLSIRKEYHDALTRAGISLDTIVEGIKNVTETATPAIKLQAWQTLMKSLGLDKYEEASEDTAKGWEDILMKMEDEKEKKGLPEPKVVVVEDYEVVEPEMPKDAKEKEEEENKIRKELYE